jgi:hypothetical protein
VAIIMSLFSVIAFISQMVLVTPISRQCHYVSVFFATFSFSLILEMGLGVFGAIVFCYQ